MLIMEVVDVCGRGAPILCKTKQQLKKNLNVLIML